MTINVKLQELYKSTYVYKNIVLINRENERSVLGRLFFTL